MTTNTTDAPPPSEVAPIETARQGVTCGVGPKQIRSLDQETNRQILGIVGGTDAVRNSWPFQVNTIFILLSFIAAGFK